MCCNRVSLQRSVDGNRVRKDPMYWAWSKDLPKIILLDGANGIDSSHVGLDTEDLQPQTGSFLNHLIGMISVLRRHGVRLPFDIGGNVLIGCQQRNSEIHGQMKQNIPFAQ